jgi:hypothetical protein
VIERLNRNDLTTQVIPFNLGKAILQGDDDQQPRAAARRRRHRLQPEGRPRAGLAADALVSLEGRDQFARRLPADARRDAESLLGRAGGFTPQAYVYGLEFSREETRQRQRENLQAAIARLQALSAVQTARDAANRRDDASGAATSAAVSNAATQAQLARLSRIEPNGRIALELTPETTSLDSLARPAARSADRITVPSRPGFVTVAGAVVNSNAFVWKAGRTAGEYLSLAGTDEAADPSNMFILRADGTGDEGRHQPRLVQPGRPRRAGDAAGRRADRADRDRLRDLGPGAGAQPEGLRADLLGLRHRHRGDQFAEQLKPVRMKSNEPGLQVDPAGAAGGATAARRSASPTC